VRWYSIAALILLTARSSAAEVGYNPNKVAVPDANTAIAIAHAVLVPIYGRQQVASEEPLVAIRRGDVWTISGTLHCKGSWISELLQKKPACVGGSAEVQLLAKDGRILHVTHYQ
jgi:hypothetical protein